MKKENTDLSRRNFLTKGTAAAAVASIIAIPALNSSNAEAAVTSTTAMMSNDPVYTESVQTLTNKTIASSQNILGTDYVNIKEFAISGSDITSALNSAIASIPNGGQILIPRGNWTSNGGHEFHDALSIEGVGYRYGGGSATSITLNSGGSQYLFRLLTPRRNCSLKNMSIAMTPGSNKIGVLMTNQSTGEQIVYGTAIENVGFYGGGYGIKVDSLPNSFECILNRFERVSFIGCLTSFYCNSSNGGYTFDNCYFSVPGGPGQTGQTALDIVLMGNLSLNHCLFVGVGFGANQPVTDGSTILKTTGAYNNISFFDCQDEALQYMYRNSTNSYDYIPIVYRNCVIQSHFKHTAPGSVVLDNTRCAGTFYDSSGAYTRVYVKGLTNFYTQSNDNAPIQTSFVNQYSQVIYEAVEIGQAVITPAATTGNQVINASRGTVNIAASGTYITVYNNAVRPQSLVFAQLRTHDSGGARIRHIYNDWGYFTIYLDKAAAAELSIGFTIEAY